MSNYLPELAAGGGAVGVIAAVWRFLRSPFGRGLVDRIGRAARQEAASLREAIDNLSVVVAAQGESIEWLRGELDSTRTELDEARRLLAEKESKLEAENLSLRARVAELETQVRILEAALAARKRRTTKKEEQ